MHIEPGIVDGAKMVFAWGTAAAAAGYSAKLIVDDVKAHDPISFVVRAAIAVVGVFVFFELFPHFSAGVSEVHFILGTTLLLLLGAGPAAIGLAGGLLVQGLFFAPTDLPMFFVNVTTLLVPMFALHALARRIVPADTAYVDLRYADVLKLSLIYQGGIVAWVAFWAIYGQGAGAENLNAVLAFGGAYMLVVVIEPVADLAMLWLAKSGRGLTERGIFQRRLHHPA